MAAVLVVCGSQAVALPVRVVLDWPSSGALSAPASVRIQGLRTAGPTEGGLQVEAVGGPDGATLDLGHGVWQLEAFAPGYWCSAAEIVVGRETPAGVRLALWPAAALHGEIRAAESEPLPREVSIRLNAVGSAAGEIATARVPIPQVQRSPSSAELRCRVDEGAWSCPGPAGVYDVRLEAAGFAPRYTWDVRLAAAASTDLGRAELRRAASVFGGAVRGDGSNPQGPCRALLQAEGMRRGSLPPGPEGALEAERSFSAPLSRRGYFQLADLPPGGYLLSVECPAASAFRELRVQADGETRVDPPLRLEELTLDVVITPRVDREGRPWLLTVEATAPRWRRIAEGAAAAADGRWTRQGLTAGSYRVALEAADGTQWLQRVFELGSGSGPLALHVGFVELAGRVLLSTQPLRARLVFFNEAGGEPVTLTSDDDGRFQGRLPVAPGTRENRWTVEVHGTEPLINRRLEGVSLRAAAGEVGAWLELALPLVAVRGTVVSEEGERQSGAQVTLEDAKTGARTVTATDEDGGFELHELPVGSYTALAESGEGVSQRTAFEVVEGVESELRLVLNRSERVTFYVVGSQGPVADAAVQIWVPPGLPRGLARTDPDGRFEASLPSGTTEVGLTVGAPGHALKLVRLPVSDEQTITLDASGGTLVLDLQRPGPAFDGTAIPYLVHEGAVEAAAALAGWGAAEGGGGGPAVIETIEPGAYALCVAGPDELAALWRGARPSARCRAGSVEQGRTLTLSSP